MGLASRHLSQLKSNLRPTPRHIIIKMAKVKDKERILKASRVIYKRAPIRLSADFSTETFQAIRDWQKYPK